MKVITLNEIIILIILITITDQSTKLSIFRHPKQLFSSQSMEWKPQNIALNKVLDG